MFIAGVLVFGSQLAIQAFTISKPEYVKEVAKWVYDYLQSEPIQKFISESGGWVSMSFLKTFLGIGHVEV